MIPSLPGFAFSAPLTSRGWSTQRTAATWAALMDRLGYQRYGAAGNDAGSMISPEIGRIDPEHVVGVHVTQVFSFPSGDPAEFEGMPAEDGAAMGKLQWFIDHKISFNQLHSQQPQTLAHALADSPAALLGWNAQLMTPDAMGGKHLDDDFILTNAALYWFTNTGGSAIRFYYEDAHGPRQAEPTTVPLGVADFAGDFSGVRRLAERDHKNLVQWTLHPEPGGHYAAHLEPQVLATTSAASTASTGKRSTKHGRASQREPQHRSRQSASWWRQNHLFGMTSMVMAAASHTIPNGGYFSTAREIGGVQNVP